jgi:hypothetical protein
MKKLLAVFLLMLSASAFAQHHHGFHRYHHHHQWRPNYGWVIPTIIGGVVTYEIVKNQQPVIVQQPTPVVIQQPQQVCTEWKEIQQPDGKIYRERTCSQ